MRIFMRSVINKIMYKRIDEAKINITHITLRKENMSYFNLSSNPIISFKYDGRLHYFRECPRIRGFKEYYQKAIESFFETLGKLSICREHFKQEIPIRIDYTSEEIECFKKYLSEKQKNKKFFTRLSQIDRISLKIHFSIWENHCYDLKFFESFSFGDIPDKCNDICIYFLWYMRGACLSYRNLNIVKGSKYSFFSAVKSVSSKIVADSIHIGHLVTSADFCKIKFDDGTELFGVLSNAAAGNRMLDTEVKVNGSLQKELIDLNILDIICYQTDHGMNNYNVYKVGENYSVCAFDNDNQNTFFPVLSIKHNFLGCSSVVNNQGMLNRPYIDAELAESIQKIDKESLKNELKPYLNKCQIFALMFRIEKLRRMLRRTKSKDPKSIIENDQWNDRTVVAETNGEYGETYLTLLMKGTSKCHNSKTKPY